MAVDGTKVGGSDVPAGSAAAAYIRQKWGRPTRAVPAVNFPAATSPYRVLKNNPRRFQWVVVNNGRFPLYFDYGAYVSINSQAIPPGGGIAESTIDEDGEQVTYEVWVHDPNTQDTCQVYEVEAI
jgi:hypothetical protein